MEDARTVERMKNCGFVCDPVGQEIYEHARSRTAAPEERNAEHEVLKSTLALAAVQASCQSIRSIITSAE